MGVDASGVLRPARPAWWRITALVVAGLSLFSHNADGQRRWSVSVAAGPTTGWLPYVEHEKDHSASWSLAVDGFFRVGDRWELGLGGGYHRLADRELAGQAEAYTFGGAHLAAMARLRRKPGPFRPYGLFGFGAYMPRYEEAYPRARQRIGGGINAGFGVEYHPRNSPVAVQLGTRVHGVLGIVDDDFPPIGWLGSLTLGVTL